MTDKNYEYYLQKDFRGGICTQAEDAAPNQVLDARNVWSPLSVAQRRPGTVSRVVGDPWNGPTSSMVAEETPYSSDIAAAYTISPVGVVTQLTAALNLYDVSSLPVGTRIVIASDTGLDLPDLRQDAAFSLAVFLGNANANNSTFLMEILTERGYVPLKCFSSPKYLFQAAEDPVDEDELWQYFWFSAPQDTIKDLSLAGLPNLTSGAGCVIRFAITSAGTSANTKFSSTANGVWFRNFNQLPVALNAVFRLQFANTTKVFTVATNDYSQNDQSETIPPFITYGMLNNLSFVPQLTPALGDFAFNISPPKYPYTFRFTQKFRAKPPTVACVPQIGYAFCAYQNVITQHYVDPTFNRPDYDPPNTPASTQAYYGPGTSNPYKGSNYGGPNNEDAYAAAIIAPVNQEAAITGPTDTTQGTIGIWPKDTIPQLPAFPAANIIIYWKNTLFAMDIAGDPQAVRWTADVNSGGWNVWPEASRAVLSTKEDNSGIVGAAQMGDNLVIFKKNSIWVLIDNGSDENNLVLFEPRPVVTGVGAMSHQSIQAIPKGLMFNAEDGFYLFDGTPDVKLLSKDVQKLYDEVTATGKTLANAVVWRTKGYYLCAVQVHQTATTDDVNIPCNNAVFAFNYRTGAWDFWTGWEVISWYQENGLGQTENLWYFDRRGRGYKLGAGSTDDGADVETMILTNRFGINDMESETAREFRVIGDNNNGQLQASLLYDDIDEFDDKPIEMPLQNNGEAVYEDDPQYDEALYVPPRRRARKVEAPLKSGEWFQIRLKDFNNLYRLALGVKDNTNR